MQPEQFLIRHQFQDVDDFAQTARAWNLNINQLERGSFKGDLLQFGTGDVMVAHADFYPGTYQQGEPSRGFRTFGIPSLTYELEFDLTRKLLTALSFSRETIPQPPRRMRDAALKRVKDYLEALPHTPPHRSRHLPGGKYKRTEPWSMLSANASACRQNPTCWHCGSTVCAGN